MDGKMVDLTNKKPTSERPFFKRYRSVLRYTMSHLGQFLSQQITFLLHDWVDLNLGSKGWMIDVLVFVDQIKKTQNQKKEMLIFLWLEFFNNTYDSLSYTCDGSYNGPCNNTNYL